MLKAGLIIGIAVFILGLGAALFSPLLVPCVALLLGLVAGYFAGILDKPADSRGAARTGALSGVIAGLGALLSQLGGAAANYFLMGPGGTAQFLQQFGFQTGQNYQSIYWISVIGSTLCFSLVDIGFMALFGLLGGLMWYQISGKQ